MEGLEQSLDEVKEYAANIQTTTKTDAAVEDLKTKLLAHRKQTADILSQNNQNDICHDENWSGSGSRTHGARNKNTATNAHMTGVQ